MQTLMLYRGLRKANVIPKGVIDWNVVIKIAVASFLMGLSLYLVIAQLGNWSDFTWYGRLIRLLGCIGFGTFVFFGSLAMMKIKIKQMLVH
jgi:hypothetical protein